MSTTQTQSAPTTLPAVVPANMFSLTGGGLHIGYSTTSIDGKPRMTYQDPMRSLSFQGDEIRKVEGDLGTVVSVTIVRTVDCRLDHIQPAGAARDAAGAVQQCFHPH